MRPANEIDFWRGFALIMIFINHVPGNFYDRYTYARFGVSDAAEIFVFLAGCSLRLLSQHKGKAPTLARTVARLEWRALTIYIAQLVIAIFALALTAAGALFFDSPQILQWNNAAPMFEAPVTAHIGLVVLSYQLGYFDILPLYVVLIAMAPLLLIAERVASWLPLALSLVVYASTLILGVNIPTWPVEGRWFLNPFAWQLVMTLGFTLGSPDGPGRFVREHRAFLRFFAAPVVFAGLWIALTGWVPDPLALPEPRLFLMLDKTFASPGRLLHLLAVVGLFVGLFATIFRLVPAFVNVLCLLGRNSLAVFCVGSILSLAGQIARQVLGGTIWVDTAVVLSGILAMVVVARGLEWKNQKS